MTTTRETPPDVRRHLRLTLALIWLIAPLWCVMEAANLLVHFFGESATSAEEAEAARWLMGAIAGWLGASVAAVALGGRTAWGIALWVSIVLSGFTAVAVADLRPDAPQAPVPSGCAVYSGSDNPCPGG